jgi:hypothetical protein
MSDELARKRFTQFAQRAEPIHDHFKKVDDDTLMGIMNGKAALDNGRFLYFYLQRV